MVVALGLALCVAHYWRRGSMLIGGGFGLAGALRLLLGGQQAGLLRVRRRAFDVIVLCGVGLAVILMALVVPPLRS